MNIKNISHIKELEKIKHLKNEFVVMNSAIMVLLGLKANNRDLDLLVTERFKTNHSFKNISINNWKRWSVRLRYFASNSRDFIDNHSFEFDGFNFCKIETHVEILKVRKSQNSGGEKIHRYLDTMNKYIKEQK